MNKRSFFLQASATAAVVALLTACGGSNDPVVSGGTGGGTTPTPAAQFATDYSAGVAALNTTAGLSNTAFLDTIDDGFLDAGYTKPVMRTQLAQEAAARVANPDLVFPGVTLTNVTISGCDANGVCTLTATATNADADTTVAPFTTKVRLTANKYRLYGDQALAPTV
ncbi:hypothetical protein [Xylophilus sp. GOD-11R]|uniref:hypothetical protein n=1 Tax=Xylophilus sp. GOD-11R TaxID=3089814 RepID=UPI00298C5A0F|nr:hypothetical protein [Xylophilus sp. GOD-11R]WPB56258.1 hypothetical protein R9X41_19250 [Xylophilus sp. GOD-11R]